MARPKILLDVDGVLNVLAHDRDLIEHCMTAHFGSTFTLRIHPHTPRLVAQLAELGDIVWCSTWLNANEDIAPLVGLPTGLPRVLFPWDGPEPSGFDRISPKAPYIPLWARDREVGTLIWLDDDTALDDPAVITTGGRSGSDLGARRALCQLVSPHVGLTQRDVDDVTAWLTWLDEEPRVTNGEAAEMLGWTMDDVRQRIESTTWPGSVAMHRTADVEAARR